MEGSCKSATSPLLPLLLNCANLLMKMLWCQVGAQWMLAKFRDLLDKNQFVHVFPEQVH